MGGTRSNWSCRIRWTKEYLPSETVELNTLSEHRWDQFKALANACPSGESITNVVIGRSTQDGDMEAAMNAA